MKKLNEEKKYDRMTRACLRDKSRNLHYGSQNATQCQTKIILLKRLVHSLQIFATDTGFQDFLYSFRYKNKNPRLTKSKI